MVPQKMWVLGHFGSDIGSVFDRSRSLVFFFKIFTSRSLKSFCRRVSESRICHFIFPFGPQESIFQGSWVQLMELNL